VIVFHIRSERIALKHWRGLGPLLVIIWRTVSASSTLRAVRPSRAISVTPDHLKAQRGVWRQQLLELAHSSTLVVMLIFQGVGSANS